jgi:hypothetical protein
MGIARLMADSQFMASALPSGLKAYKELRSFIIDL